MNVEVASTRDYRDAVARVDAATTERAAPSQGGSANFPGYNTSHGHPPGRGAWEWEGYRRTLEAVRDDAKDRGIEAALMQEQSSELAMPYHHRRPKF